MNDDLTARLTAVRGANYVPSTAVSDTQLWEEFDQATIERELGYAEGLGLNSVRVFLQYLVFEHEPAALLERFDRFCAIAARHGLSVMPVLFDDCFGPEPQLGPYPTPPPGVHNPLWRRSPGKSRLRLADRGRLRRYLEAFVGGFGQDPRILAWDLYNEPAVEPDSVALLRDAFAWARRVAPAQPLTACWAGALLSDVTSVHLYTSPSSHPEDVERVLESAGSFGRPVLVTEFLGRPSRGELAELLPVFAERGIGWYFWELMIGADQTRHPWDRDQPQPEDMVFQGVLHPDGTPYREDEARLLRSCAERAASRELATLPDGTAVTRTGDGAGLEVVGVATVEHPVVVERWDGHGPGARIAQGYDRLHPAPGGGWVGRASVRLPEGATLAFTDRWSVDGPVLRVRREVEVTGEAPGGFLTEFGVDLPAGDTEVFAPGMLYGDPDRLTAEAIGGRASADVAELRIREDRLPAPLLGVRLPGGRTLALLDAEPDGATVAADAMDVDAATVTDAGLRFGALGLSRVGDGRRLAYTFPGTEGEVTYRGDRYPGGQLRTWRRRYHPVTDGHVQRCTVELRVGAEDRLPALATAAWRWAWSRLRPQVRVQNLDMVRETLLEHLAERVVTTGGRTGIPIVRDAVTGRAPGNRGHANHALMGFCGRNPDLAFYLLREADRVGGARGERYRGLGQAVLDTFTSLSPSPPEAEGFDLDTGELVCSAYIKRPNLVHLRSVAEGGKSMVRAWQLEAKGGRDHPAWLAWSRELAGWLLTRQDADGSFPRAWQQGTGEVALASPLSTYNAVPFLVAMHTATGERRYLDAAVAAGEFCWRSGHDRHVFVGGTLDNPDVIDKEAGTVSLEAYLALYEATGGNEWLPRARAAADFAETWVYLWDVPVPPGTGVPAWKPGASTVGLQLISSGHSLVDAYMAFDAGSYARLSRYTGDGHYREVARVLLHNTKQLLALPGREFDLAGPGWQQEHWSLAPRRGRGLHRFWLPWLSCSHLEGIAQIEDFDPELLAELS